MPPTSARPSRIEDPALMSFVHPFCRVASLAAVAGAAVVLLMPASMLPARAQTAEAAHQITLSDSPKSESAKSDVAKPPASPASGTGPVASVADPSQQKSLTAKA